MQYKKIIFSLLITTAPIYAMQTPTGRELSMLIFNYDVTNPNSTLPKTLQRITIQNFIHYLEKKESSQACLDLMMLLQKKKTPNYHIITALYNESDRKKIRKLFAKIVPQGSRAIKKIKGTNMMHHAHYFWLPNY